MTLRWLLPRVLVNIAQKLLTDNNHQQSNRLSVTDKHDGFARMSSKKPFSHKKLDKPMAFNY